MSVSNVYPTDAIKLTLAGKVTTVSNVFIPACVEDSLHWHVEYCRRAHSRKVIIGASSSSTPASRPIILRLKCSPAVLEMSVTTVPTQTVVYILVEITLKIKQ